MKPRYGAAISTYCFLIFGRIRADNSRCFCARIRARTRSTAVTGRGADGGGRPAAPRDAAVTRISSPIRSNTADNISTSGE